jgi:hypothetical protein
MDMAGRWPWLLQDGRPPGIAQLDGSAGDGCGTTTVKQVFYLLSNTSATLQFLCRVRIIACRSAVQSDVKHTNAPMVQKRDRSATPPGAIYAGKEED